MAPLKRLVLDIETVGLPLESLGQRERAEVERWAAREEVPAQVYSRLSLNELTGRIVAIGLMNVDSGKGQVHFQPTEAERASSEDDLAEFVPGSESDILEAFWELATSYDQLITFNGRGFDLPFILLRSAVHRIPPRRDLMPNRYRNAVHCDLMDQLRYFGATRTRSLNYYCQLLGIETLENKGMDGSQVGTLWDEKRYVEIAEYCWGDVKSTGELYRVWSTYINPFSEGSAPAAASSPGAE
ncbi:MAG: ribonuclease H-like domain-containing protein [Anaerolineae bacterium]